MKRLLSLVFLIAILFSSCSTSNNVASNNFLQKRKYRKGFHVSNPLKKHPKKASAKTASMDHSTELVDLKVTNKEGEPHELSSDQQSKSLTAKNEQEAPKKFSIREQKEKMSKKITALNAYLAEEGHRPREGIARGSRPDEPTEEEEKMGLMALVAGIAAWVFSIFSFLPVIGWALGAFALVAAILAVVIGRKVRKVSTEGNIGMILGLVWLALFIIFLLLLLLLIVLILLAFSSV